MTNYTITPQQIMKALGVSKQRLYQLRQEHLKENIDFIKVTEHLFLYNQQAIDKLKEIIK